MAKTRKPRGVPATETGRQKLQEAQTAGRDENGKRLIREEFVGYQRMILPQS
jgi:hypothetical protein